MTMENNPPRQQPRAAVYVRRPGNPISELNNVNQGSQSSSSGQRTSGTFGAASYRLVEEVGARTEGGGPDSDSEYVNIQTDEEDDTGILIECPSCDFEIVFPPASCMKIDPEDMLCPVCDEILEDAIKMAHRLHSQKRTLKSDESGVSSGNPVVSEKKVPSRGSKHEPVPEPLLSPFIHNVSDPTSSGSNPGEDSSSNTSDIANAKGSVTDAPADSGNEEDTEGKRLKASFIQELVMSTLI